MAPNSILRLAAACVIAFTGCGDQPEESSTTQPDRVAPDQPSWPTGTVVPSTAVGYLPGSANVTRNGVAQYSIPLEVPPGRLGMQPAISLEYSSSGPNGLMGVGWGFTGFSQITPCSKNWSSEATADGVDWDDTDVYCLDGQKLVAAGLFDGVNQKFRTERDTWADVIAEYANGNQFEPPIKFTVRARDGRTSIYTAHTQKVATSSGPSDESIVWLVDKTSDRAGNAMTFAYEEDKQALFPWSYASRPKRITYTVDDLPPTSAGDRYVEIDYEDRSPYDLPFAYNSGLSNTITKRVKSISMYAPMAPNQPASLVWRYNMHYRLSGTTMRQLVDSVTQCDAANVCKWAKQFRWATDSASLAGANVTTTVIDEHVQEAEMGIIEPVKPPQVGKPPLVIGDFDNDGKDDLIYWDSFLVDHASMGGPETGHLTWTAKIRLSTSGPLSEEHVAGKTKANIMGVDWLEQNIGPFHGLNLAASRAVDLDGDGVQELYEATNPGNDTQYAVYKWNNTTKTFDAQGAPVTRRKVDFVDLNGDGLMDRIEVISDHWYVSFNKVSNPGTFDVAVDTGVTDYGDDENPLTQDCKDISAATDMDGDGRGDYLVSGFPCTQATRIFTDDSGTLQSAPFLFPVLPAGELDKGVRFADWNGDGLDDLVVGGSVSINYGHGFMAIGADTDMGTEPIDINNDGRVDLISGEGATFIAVSLSNATTPDYYFNIGVPSAVLTKHGDFDGDGVQEFVAFNKGIPVPANPREGRLLLHKLDLMQTSDILTEVKDEGASHPREVFTYSRTWSEKPSAQTCTYPQQCMKKGMQVVRALAVSQGEGLLPATQVTRYSYDKPRRDVKGRGFLGFGMQRRTDAMFGEHTTYTDNATRIHIGGHDVYPMATTKKVDVTPIFDEPDLAATVVPATFRAKVVTRIPVSETVTTAPAAYLTRQKSWTQTEEDQDATLNADGIVLGASKIKTKTRTSASTFDAFNNPLTIDEVTSGGESTHRDLRYTNDTTKWILGQLSRSSEQTWETGAVVPAARVTDYTYYATNGLLLRTTRELSDATSLYQHTELTRDDRGLVTTTTVHVKSGQPDHVDTVAYDAQGIYPQLRKNAEGHWTWDVYHPALGKPVVSMNPNGVLTSYKYDGFGRPALVSPAGGISVTTSYKAALAGTFNAGIETIQTRADGGKSTQITDEQGRIVTTKSIGFDGGWVVFDKRYNVMGVATSESRPGANAPSASRTKWTYDTLGRLRKTVTPDSKVTSTVYATTAATRTATTTDPDLRVTTTVSNVDERPIRQDEPAPAGTISTKFEYGPWGGLLRTAIDSKLNQVKVEYDKLGRRTKLTDPDIGITNYTYTGFDELRTEATSLQTRTYSYDKLSRRTEIVDPAGSTVWNWDTAPGSIGNIWRTQSPQGVVITRDFDAFGRISKETTNVPAPSAAAFGVLFEYDAFGRNTITHLPGASGLLDPSYKNVYNAFGYLESRGDNSGDFGGWKWSVKERELDGQLRKEVEGIAANVETTTTHSAITGKVTQVAAKNLATSASLFSLAYTYFDGGNVKTRADAVAGRSEAYEYDGLDRITKWTLTGAAIPSRTMQYAYDDIGNLTKVSVNSATVDTLVYSGPRPHAVSTMNGLAFTYDAMGRQLDGPRRTVGFNPSNLPKQLTDKQGAGVIDYLYDADNLRRRKTSSLGDITNYVGGYYERRTTPTGTTQVYYLPGESAPVAQFVKPDVGAGALSLMIGDKQGTVSVVLSSALAVLERRFTEPFGGAVAANGTPVVPAASAVTRGFTGHELENELGLINMRGRIYDPALRRFVSPDPAVRDIKASQTFNRYSYVANNPTARIDPTGFNDVEDSGEITVSDLEPADRDHDDLQEGPDPIEEEPVTAGWSTENGDGGGGGGPPSSTDQGTSTQPSQPMDTAADKAADASSQAGESPSLDSERHDNDQANPSERSASDDRKADSQTPDHDPAKQASQCGDECKKPFSWGHVLDKALVGALAGGVAGVAVGVAAGLLAPPVVAASVGTAGITGFVGGAVKGAIDGVMDQVGPTAKPET